MPYDGEFLGVSWVGEGGVGEVWAALVEKAVAKVFGTYYDLAVGWGGVEGFVRMLTGLPVSKYDLVKDVRSYILLIDSALRREHIVVLE